MIGEEGKEMSHRYGPTNAGTVLLDLGADTGALVLYTPADLLGAEIEVSPDTPVRRGRTPPSGPVRVPMGLGTRPCTKG